MLPGFVEQLDLGSNIRDTLRGGVSQSGYRANDGWRAAKAPRIITGIGDHELESPRLSRSGATPDIVDAQIQDLIEEPGAKWPGLITRRRESGLDIPRDKECASRMLITAENLNIDILMLPSLRSQEEVDGPSSRNPPGNSQRSEERRDIVRTPGLPSSQWMSFICHLRASSVRATFRDHALHQQSTSHER